MNARNIFKIGALVFVLSLLVSAAGLAQTTRYVNNTNGDDLLFTGSQAQPFKTIAKAIAVASDGDIISIASDTYNETTVGLTKNITLVSTSFNGLTTATITNGINVNITTGSKVANLGRTADGSLQFNLGVSTSALTLTSGALNIDGSNVIIGAGATITRSAGSINATPTTTNINLIYSPAGDLTAGPEVPANINTGTIVVNVVVGKTVTFPSPLTVGANGFVQNAGLGSVVFSGAVTFAGATYAAGVITNSTNGNLSFSLPVAFAPTTNQSTTLFNNGTGTLALNGGSSNNGKATIAITNGSTGTVALAGGNYNGAIVNDNAGTISITGATEFSGTAVSNNNAGSKIKLAGNQLTISGTGVTLTNIGFIYSNTVSTIGTGVLNITGSVVTAGVGEYPNVTVAGSGTLTLGANATLYGDYNQTSTAAGALTFGANTLDVKGSFNRSSNAPGDVVPGTGTLSFSGTGSKGFVPGASMTVYNLVVNKTGTGDVLTMGQSLIIGNSVVITAGSLNLGDNNIRMGGGASTFSNAGNFYSSTGNGYLIFEGAAGTITGAAGTWGNMDVRVGAGTVTATTNIKFSGILVLRSGTLALGANTMTLTSTNLTVPKISVLAGALTPGGGLLVNVVAPATFYDLEYVGAADYTAAAEWLAGSGLRNVSVATTGGHTVTSPGVSSIAGALSVASGQVLALGGATTLTGDNVTHQITGSVTGALLTVTGAGSAVNGSTVVADAASLNSLAFEPAANNAAFTVSNVKTVTGNVTIEGTSTKTGTTATLGILTIGGNFTIGNGTNAATVAATIGNATVGGLTGNLVLTNGALTLTMGSLPAVIGGTATYTAGSLTLGSNLSVTGATTFGGADINLVSFNYIDLSGTVTRTTGGFAATTGKLRFTKAAGTAFTPFSGTGTSFSIPNLENVAGVTTVATDFTVTNVLTLTAGTLAMGVNNLTITGPSVVMNGALITGTGNVNFTGTTTVTANGSYAVPNVVVNSAGAVTLASTSSTARTFTFTTLVQTAGDINLGINTLALNGGATSFTRVAGNWTMTTGELLFNSATLTFDPGTGFAVDNLEVAANAAATAAQVFTVNKLLTLTGGVLTTSADGNLILGNGATIVRNTGVLAYIPAFGTTVNVTYTGAVTTAKELPVATTVLATLLVKNSVTLAASATVNTTLDLNTGTLTIAAAKTLTLASGALYRLQVGAGALAKANSTTSILSAPNYNLEYYGSGSVTSNLSYEFPNTSTALNNVSINGTTTTVVLDANKTVSGNLVVNATSATNTAGGLQLFDNTNGYTLTVKGNVTFTKGGIVDPIVRTTASATKPTLAFGGTMTQVFTVPAAGYAFTNATDVATAKVFNEVGEVPPTYMTINNAEGVILAGGNVTMGVAGVVNFVNGQFNTALNNTVLVLQQSSSAANQPVQGFDRSGVATGNYSHVVGNVRKFIDRTDAVAIQRVEFPVGSGDTSTTVGYYRPYAAFFKTAPQSSVNLTVSHVNARPAGTNGYPITADNLLITNYPDFFWYVKSDQTLQPSYVYDTEIQAQGYTDYTRDQIENVRLVRRDSGNVNNPWILQRNIITGQANYDNSTIALNWPVVKVFDATGGITTQGSIFTYSQSNKPPKFTSAPGNVAANEGTTFTGTFVAIDPDINQTATLSLQSASAPATFNPATGVLTWVIGYDSVKTGTKGFAFTIRATDNSGLTDGTQYRDTTIVVTVTNVNRPPVITVKPAATITVKNDSTYKFTYVATDADGDAVTFSLAPGAPAGLTLTAGVINWVPTFLQSGNSFTFKVYATDINGGMDSATTVATVQRSQIKGDINNDGVVGVVDASLALQHAAGITVIAPTDTVKLWAGDVSGNGFVTAYDASLILRKIAGEAIVFAPKMGKAYSGSISFGQTVPAEGNVLSIPVSLSNAQNITSIQFTVNIDAALATFQGVKTNLPKDWTVLTSNVDGKVSVAMAGVTPVSSSDVASIAISMKDKSASINVKGEGFVNEADNQSLTLDNVRMLPNEYALDQNYPNPFNPSTTIKYQLTQDSKVNLTIYNVQGQVVRTLVNDNVSAGFQSVSWNGKNEMGQTVASGMYMYRIQAGSFVSVKKMLMLK